VCEEDGWLGEWGSTSGATLQGEGRLHRVATVVKIDGTVAKFYAGEGHTDVMNGKLKAGDLIYTSSCEENNIMACILYEGIHDINSSYSNQQAIWYFWDDWLDASIGKDVKYIDVGNGWLDMMKLPNGQYMELTHSNYLNKNWYDPEVRKWFTTI